MSQIKINEIMVNPGSLAVQGLIGGGKEYIELYNPTCLPINVGGYFIATTVNVSGTNRGGSFRIPKIAKAIVAPNSHLVLGTALSSTDSNSIDIKLPSYTSNVCELSTGTFVMSNFDNWIGLYDTLGVPMDAVYWGASPAVISQTADFGVVPCVPSGSPSGIVLKSAQQINAQNPGVLQYGGANPSSGQTHSRNPDGGSWSFPQAASINHATGGANANCNGGVCNTIGFYFVPSITQPTCGNSNGSISIATLPSSTKTYTWSTNANTGNNNLASNLSAGSYTVSVSQNGCTKDTTIVLTTTSKPIFTTNTTQPTCTNALGSISVNVTSSGTATFSWSTNANTGNNSSASSLSAGTYTVTVSQNGCSKDTTIQLNTVVKPSISPNIINPTCGNSNGSISLSISPTGTNSFSWSTNANTGNNANAVNLSAGTYTVTVTQNGCNKDTTLTLTTTQIPSISSTVTSTTCGQNNGSVSLSISPIGTNSYSWSTNANTGNNANAVNLSAGTYTVTVTQNGCTASLSNTVNSSVGVSYSISKVNDNCSQGIGSISVNIISSGTATYSWSANANTGNSANASNLTAGSYTLTVTQNGCNKDTSLTIFNSSSSIVIQKNILPPTCGLSNGSISLNVTSSGTTSYNWSTNANTGNQATANGLKSGSYSVTVSQNGCSSDTTFNLTDPFNPSKDTIFLSGCSQIVYKSKTYFSNSFLLDTIKKIATPFCDSIYRGVYLNVSYSDTTYMTKCILTGQNYPFYSQNISNAGIYYYQFTNINNCDSIIKLTLTVLAPKVQPQNKVSCNAYYYKNIWYRHDTTLYDTLKNVLGCDSIYQALFIQILKNDTSVIKTCSNKSFNFYNRIMTTSGTYYQAIPRTNQCDSIVKLILTIQNTSNNYIDTFICSNTIIANKLITKDTSFIIQTVQSKLGCDSVYTFLNVKVNKPLWILGITFSGCDSVIYKTKKYTQSQSIMDTIRKKIAPFCDSIYTTHTITILPKVVYSKEYSPDSMIEQGESVMLTVNGGDSYQWSSVSMSNSIRVAPLSTKTYYVTVSSPNRCSVKDSFIINVKEIPSYVLLPSAFSPNGDQINDFFRPNIVGKAQVTSFMIFDRWGEKLYEGFDNNCSWDGTYNSDPLPVGVYVYYLKYRTFGRFDELKGSVTLIK